MKPDGKPDFWSLTECLDAAQAAINGQARPGVTVASGTEAIEQAKATLAEMRKRYVRAGCPCDHCLRMRALIGEEKP